MAGPGGLGAGAVWLVAGALLSSTLAAEEGSALVQTGPGAAEHQWTLALVVGAVCVLALVVYALVACTDCYNSEVSSDCHPASATYGAAKWGGAGGYSATPTTDAATSSSYADVNRTVLFSGFAGDSVGVPPGDGHHQPLPYALIPTGAPEVQGFCGYAPVEGSSAPLGGYGSTAAQQPSMMGYGGSPAVQPPSMMGYGGSPAVQPPSMMGYGGSPAAQPPSGVGYGGSPAVQPPSVAGYGGTPGGYGSSGVPQASLAGYGTSAGGPGSYSSATVPQPSLAGYGSSSQGQSGFGNPSAAGYGGGAGEGQAGGGGGGGGAAQRQGWGAGGGSSRPLPGAHVPLMTPEAQDPPPPYFASAPYQQ